MTGTSGRGVETDVPPEEPSSGATTASGTGDTAPSPPETANPIGPTTPVDADAPGERETALVERSDGDSGAASHLPVPPVPPIVADAVPADAVPADAVPADAVPATHAIAPAPETPAAPAAAEAPAPGDNESWPHREPQSTTDTASGAAKTATAGRGSDTDTDTDTDDTDDDGNGGGDDGATTGAGGRRSGRPGGSEGVLRRKFEIDVRILGLVLLVVAVAVGAYFLGHRSSTSTSKPPSAAASNKVPTEFTSFNDPVTGTKLAFPKAWTRLPTANSEADIRLALSAGGSDLVLLRVIPLEGAVTAANMGDVKAVTDALVSGQKVNVLQQQQVEVNGLPGYYYLYTYTDAQTGQQGVHAHYFLFQGKKMNSIVFQAQPSTDFQRLAPTFDQVANSFHSAPGDLPPGLAPSIPPTTAAAPGGSSPSTAPPTTG